MLAVVLIRILRLGLVLSLAIALSATGLAHHTPAQQSAAQVEALAFAAANGATLADFCGGAPTAGQDRHCPACQITGTADLPPASLALVDLRLATAAPTLAPRQNAVARVRDPSRSPQGPPAV